MSEFEVVIPIEGNKYGDCVILQKYGDQYKLLAGKMSKNPNGTPFLRWVFPQTKEKTPHDKAIPLQINLGPADAAYDILVELLAAMPKPGGNGKQDDIQF